MALITAEIYRNVIETKGTGLDTRLTDYLIPMGEALAAFLCHRVLPDGTPHLENDEADITQYLDGGEVSDRKYIYPAAYPITEVTSVHLDGSRAFGASALLTVDTDYFVDARKIYLISGAIPKGPRTGKLVYQGGFTSETALKNLQIGICMLIAWLDGNKGKQHMASQAIANLGLSTSFIKEIPADVKLMLGPFRRPLG